MLKPFSELKKEAMENKDKVAFLTEVFKVLHNDAPPEDFIKLGGRLAGIVNQAGKDYLIVLQAIWKSSADGIVASHLNFIQAIVKNKTGNVYTKKTSNLDRVFSDKILTKRLSATELRDKERQEISGK